MSTSNNQADSDPCGKDCVPTWLGFVSYYIIPYHISREIVELLFEHI